MINVAAKCRTKEVRGNKDWTPVRGLESCPDGHDGGLARGHGRMVGWRGQMI